jgi:hypothetical protein
MNRIESAFELFDHYNREDPRKMVWDGTEYPVEYFYSLQLYNWIKRLRPNASEALQLASRCQHIGRWKIPRDKYPEGKAGYLKWRNDLAKFHAETTAALLSSVGYDKDEIRSVQRILLKENLKLDEEVQTMENALSLVFLEFQFEDFSLKHEEEKLTRILQKTWKKMSQEGREVALTLALSKKSKELLQKMLNK